MHIDMQHVLYIIIQMKSAFFLECSFLLAMSIPSLKDLLNSMGRISERVVLSLFATCMLNTL